MYEILLRTTPMDDRIIVAWRYAAGRRGAVLVYIACACRRASPVGPCRRARARLVEVKWRAAPAKAVYFRTRDGELAGAAERAP